MHQFRDKSLAQRELVSAGLLFYPVLMAADVLAYRAHEVPVGEDQREHVELMRDTAERFNRRFGETLVVPEARIPEVGARIRDLQDPTRKMSTTAASEQGTVYVLDEPDAIMRKFKRAVTDSGTDIVRAPDKPGISNLIELLARHPRHERRGRRARVRRLRATATSRSRSARRSSTTSRRCASATTTLRGDEAELERILAAGAERARAMAAETLADVRERMGVGPPARSVDPRALASLRRARHRRPPPGARPRRLRGAVRPPAVADPARGARPARGRAGRGRARLPRPPRGARRARPRGHDRVPGPDRRAARAQVAADAAGRGGRGARRARARRGGRRAARADAALRALPRRRRLAGRAQRAAPRRCSTAPRRCPTSCAGCRSSRPRPPTTPPCSARRSAACCARRRRSTSATWRCRASRSASASRTCASCCARGTFAFDEAVEGRRPRDRRGHAVRAARALQARRGELGAGRAVRRRSRWRRRDAAGQDRRGAAVPLARAGVARRPARRHAAGRVGGARRADRAARRPARPRRRAEGDRRRLDARLAPRGGGGRAAAARRARARRR